MNRRSMHALMVPDQVSALIRKMHPYLKRRIRTALKAILADPSSGKTLKNELAGLQSYRVGTFRIIYRSSGKIIELDAIGPRTKIYGETYDILKRTKEK